MGALAKFIPLNPMEHENMLRTIIVKHQGSTSGNPTQWVVDAVNEAYNAGFGLGFDVGLKNAMREPPAPPAFKVQLPDGVTAGYEPPRALPMLERVPKSCAASHDFYTVYKGDMPTGQRCKNCGKQEWF